MDNQRREGGRSAVLYCTHLLSDEIRQEYDRLSSELETGYDVVGDAPAGVVRGTFKLMWMAFRILLTCIKEAPEISMRRIAKRHAKSESKSA